MGASRNCLFLCVDDESVLVAAGMLKRWSDGWIEPIEPPPHPRHIAAQQLMALCLQEHRIGAGEWPAWWGDLPVFDESARQIIEYLLSESYFEADGPFLQIGPEAERRFGRRYFSDLTAVFTAPPEFLVLAGRVEIGTIGTDLLTEEVEGPRVLLLGGWSWKVTHVDWERRGCFVEAVDSGGQAKWSRRAVACPLTLRAVCVTLSSVRSRASSRSPTAPRRSSPDFAIHTVITPHRTVLSLGYQAIRRVDGGPGRALPPTVLSRLRYQRS